MTAWSEYVLLSISSEMYIIQAIIRANVGGNTHTENTDNPRYLTVCFYDTTF